MPRSRPLPHALRHTSFDVTAAASLGLRPGRLAGRDLAKPFRGVRTHSVHPATAIELCTAYASRMPPDEFFCDVSAAMLWGMPLPLRLARREAIDVGVAVPSYPPQARGVIAHRLPTATELSARHGLPVTGPLTTWRRLAPLMTVDELVVVGDYLVSRHFLALPLDELLEFCAKARWFRGVARIRQAGPLIRQHVRSPKESEARLLFHRAGLPEPEVNAEILDASGNFLLEGDFTFRRHKVIVEYDGDHHRTDRAQWRTDIRRRERAADEGWRMIHMTDDDLGAHSRAFVERLARLLNVRGR